jgi:hypothetical protein
MQLNSRGPSGPARGSSRGKTMRDAVAAACQRDAPARFADRHRTPPPPPPSTSIRCHAYGEKGTEGRPRRAGARHPRQGDRSGRTSAVVSASARHAFGVGATTRSPSLPHGWLRVSRGGPSDRVSTRPGEPSASCWQRRGQPLSRSRSLRPARRPERACGERQRRRPLCRERGTRDTSVRRRRPTRRGTFGLPVSIDEVRTPTNPLSAEPGPAQCGPWWR